jgi:hypothetical protein
MIIRFTWRSALSFLLVALAFPGAACARAGQFWQLTFTYNDASLSLLRAAQMPQLLKAPRTPGLAGAALRLEQELEWLDVQGKVLLATPVTLPLGGHSVVVEGGVAAGSDEYVAREGTFVVRVAGPADRNAVAQVRLRQRGADAGAIAAAAVPADPRTPRAFLAPEQTFTLPDGLAAAAVGPVSATKIRNTGPDGNRFVIAILGDGFTAADLASGSFANKATSFLNALFATSPWNTYASTVNAYRVDIESAESGADYEDASPEAGGTQKDTYLNGGFWVGGTDRCCFLRGSGIARAMAAADDLVGVGVWDEILVFVNSPVYGGCGGAVGVSSINGASDQIQIHEFGHSFAGLADEYDYGSTATGCTPNSTRNIDCSNNFPLVKWQVWVTPGTPIPTPDSAQYNTAVGAFEGAAYQTIGIFRPMRDCAMRSLGAAFCPICKEAHILRLFRELRIADSTVPPLGPADVPSYGTRVFRTTPISVGGLSYRWFTNGVAIAGATSPLLAIAGSQVSSPDFELRLETTHTTPMVRAEPIVQSNLWILRALPEPTISIADSTVVEGNSGETNLVFTVLLSFAHTNAVSVRFDTVNGTASAASDYAATNGVLTFAPGQATNFIRVNVHGDTTPEPDEVLFVRLSAPTNGTLGRAQGAGLILDRDQPPGVALTAPAPGQAFAAPATIGIVGNAFDTDGFVTRVEFFAGASPLGAVLEEPFSLTWSNVPPGNYALTAIATDNSGKLATSAPVNISVLAGAAQQLTLVGLTNAWRYDATVNNYGTAWKEPAYDDSLWSGPAPALLHNEGDTVPGPKITLLPLTENGTRIRSYYFRTHFDFPGAPAPGLRLVCSNLVDDGAVFWLNGAELGRLRMPVGAIARTTLAGSAPPGSDATNYDVLTFSAANLRAGDNVLAVEVHQQSDTSSDVVFGMSVEAFLAFAPVITDPTQPADRTATQGRSTTLSVSAAASPPPAYQWFRNGTAISGATGAVHTVANMTAALAGGYFAHVTNVAGTATSRVAQVSYQGDADAPTLVSALGRTLLNRITVYFSEPVNVTDGRAGTNYLVTSSRGSNLVVLGALVQFGTNITLATDPRVAGENYTVTVNNVRDTAGNVIAPNSTIPVATEMALLGGNDSVWHYFQSDRAPNPGWNVPGYEDFSEWENGPALFDAKTPAGRTAVGPSSEPVRTMLNLTNPPGVEAQTLTYYFRTAFDFPGPPAGARLRLRALVDDGAVFYLNGSEVLRLRMPAAPAVIGYATLATATQDDAQNSYEGPIDLPVAPLRKGRNILAAEVHQSSDTSSDLSFVAQLTGEVPRLESTTLSLSITPAPGGFTLSWEFPEAMLEEAPSVTGPWTPVTPAAASPHLVTPAGTERYFRLRSPWSHPSMGRDFAESEFRALNP